MHICHDPFPKQFHRCHKQTWKIPVLDWLIFLRTCSCIKDMCLDNQDWLFIVLTVPFLTATLIKKVEYLQKWRHIFNVWVTVRCIFDSNCRRTIIRQWRQNDGGLFTLRIYKYSLMLISASLFKSGLDLLHTIRSYK